LLARALGSANTSPHDSALAREWNCAVLGSPPNQAFVLRVVASEASLDAAVAETRSLLDRLRQGFLREEDRSRAAASLAEAATLASLDPRARVIDLWRGDVAAQPPSLDALRSFAASLKDEALVIVAARTPHVDAGVRPLRDPNTNSRP
ncbi:MAG: hypothetical protein M3O36_13255, partial [Myxococcota bacterium]|nr:hypothetical protein [Myxococcota bacterium]